MDNISNGEAAIELLQQLGLKEYEAKAFVALTRVSRATAKEINDISEVPRTRVYDAVRVLESKGLVEIQHSNPQQFRAVPIDEAVDTLRSEYESRTATLRETLQGLEPIDGETESEVTHEVWSLSGTTATTNRTKELVNGADEEVVVVLGHESAVSESLIDHLNRARHRGVNVIVGTVVEAFRDRIQTELPNAEVFVSEIEWLSGGDIEDDDTDISRLLLVDRSIILVSTIHESAGGRLEEQAVFGRGFDNGLVTIVRRLMATGLLPVEDPGTDPA